MRNIIMSAGLGIYSQLPLWEQFEIFKSYSKMNIISTAFILDVLHRRWWIIENIIHRAKKYGRVGYSLNLEAYYPIATENFTDFIVNRAHILKEEDLTLSLWIEDSTLYNFTNLWYIFTILQLITMSTYNTNYYDFTYTASNLMAATNVSDIGFGFLTKVAFGRDAINKTEFSSIIDWLLNTSSQTISIWSSYVEETWYESMFKFINN